MNRFFAAVTFGCALLATSGTAHAFDIPALTLKAGVRGGASVPFMLEPAGTEASPDVPYASYYGVGYNVGLNLHFRALDIISIETGWYRSWDNLSGTIELDDVRESAPDGRLRKQEALQRFRTSSDHIPVVLQVAIPISVARPFVSVGVDFALNRSNRRYNVESSGDPVPGVDEDGLTADLAQQWQQSARGQNLLNATLNDDPGTTVGIVAGVGVNIALDKVELPVELRAVITPSAGGTLSDRGDFPSSGAGPTRYNDVWSTQVFLMLGLDYVIF